ncbi:2'-5' RNA ligase family protein [Pseudoclavibacter terrae]|uniref:2'-5' RNA ligase family protein n=1 Tax=Pseudoclavibacter terrae TaxID=1530195 RepID=A0A7J5AXS8_9MICO|nr:2'-5' RNA ligase family protein [Pseudoclavibacter terrae]KAB1636277.1 2'-5' RNA ligase family protein [Pseudoclavibacter terrae]
MSEIVSLELLFDELTEARIRDEWRMLQELGVSSMGAHTSASNRPHLSLLVRGRVAPVDAAGLNAGAGAVAAAESELDAVTVHPPLVSAQVRRASGRLPLAVTLGAPMLFRHGDRAVFARSVLPTSGLLDLHAEVHALAGMLPSATDLPNTTPGHWTPHVTLARRLKLADLERALSALELEPIEAQATELRLWDARIGTARQLA